MPTINQNLVVQAGDTLEVSIALSSLDGDEPLDLSGASAWWHMSKRPQDGNALLTRSSTVGNINLTHADGAWAMSFTINHADTKALAPGGYYHDAIIVGGDGSISTVMTGKVEIRPSLSSRLHP